MRKYINFSIFYAIAGMICGIFYREFTKFNDFTGVTALGKAHGHLFALGMIMFLIVALFAQNNDLEKQKTFRIFLYVYNVGLPLTVIMFVVRGVTEVLNIALSTGADAAISGIAGIGHILTGVGLFIFLATLKKSAKN